MSRYRNRMVDVADVAPQGLIPHPDNWRLHSELQKDSVDQALASIGTLQRIVVNKPTGRVIDGHLRLALAIEHGEATVPVQYVELDDSEEAAALATFDPLGDMAHEDAKKLRLNIERANLDWLPKSGVGRLLQRLAPPMPLAAAAAGAWPEREKRDNPLVEMTFMVSQEQRVLIDEALRDVEPDDDPDNDSRPGNALAGICRAWRAQSQSS